MSYKDLTVIIPTLNEGRNIGKMLTLLEQYAGLSVLVCDDGSSDNTKEVVQAFKFARFLDRTRAVEHGLTASVLDGLTNCKTPYAVIMDGDLQHPPEAIPEFQRKLKSAQVVVGTRVRVATAWPWYRRLISKTATVLAKIVLAMRGTGVADPMSGFFGIQTRLMNSIDRSRCVGKGYKVLLDILKQVRCDVQAVPYTFGARDAGASKLRLKHWIWFVKSLLT